LPKFIDEAVVAFSAELRGLEAQEPLLCAWRYQGGPGTGTGNLFPTLLRILADRRRARKALEGPAPGQIVVAAYSPLSATWGTLAPILRELASRGEPAYLLYSDQTRPILSSVPHRGAAHIMALAASLPIAVRVRHLFAARRLARSLRRVLPPNSDGGAERWLEWALSTRAAAGPWLKGAGALAADSDIEAPRMALFGAARAAGVPSAVLQHGFFSPHQFPLHAHRLLTWGGYFSRQAIVCGLSPGSEVEVGCPRWDGLDALRREPRIPAVREAMGGRPGRPLVLIISNAHGAEVYPRHYTPFFEGLRNLVETGLEVAVRLHPVERDLRYYRPHLPDSITDALRTVPQSLSLHDALRHSDVVYHVFSAAALEAMLLGVPVLFERGEEGAEPLTDLPGNGGGRWTGPSGVVRDCAELGTAGEARGACLEAQERFLEGAFSHRGRATEAACASLLRLAGRPA
jgi:hypothetical protein